ncbi:MAG: hypothetical protein QOI62_3271 [Solirubrobacteraceae bacterium]|jgi:hypothetical protein|nr:hypothetical protein [Solirubrobacteraceae bacterium]
MSSPLRDALERAEIPDAEGAQGRAWAALSEAHAARVPRRRSRAPRRRSPRVGAVALAALLLLAAAVAVAAEPPHWVRQVLDGTPAHRRSSLGPLPAGRLLVSSPRGTWIVRADGTRTRLGPWTDATWSPRGLYVAAWRGRELSAVAPDGRVAWTLAAPGVVRDVRWSPDGFRIAYRHDDALAVIAGDGTAPRRLAAPVGAVAPAWRPGEPHTLAWVDAHGRVAVADVDAGVPVWGSAAPVGADVRELQWSADGHRLLARGPSRVVVLDIHGNRVWRMRLPRGARVDAAVWAPRGPRLALVVRVGPVSRVEVLASSAVTPTAGRAVLAVRGTLASLAWSPDGRTLVVRRREADQWLLAPADGRGAATAIGAVSRRFEGVPTVRGWCCAG